MHARLPWAALLPVLLLALLPARTAVAQGGGAGSDLATLAAGQRWEDVIAAADERLTEDPQDNLALYWKGRATAQSAEPLLAGRAFARDLGRSMLQRAQALLAEVRELSGDPSSDAREWWFWCRYLLGPAEDPDLPADLERWFTEEGRGYAAHLRGLIARDSGDGDAVAWLGKAAKAAPARAEFALSWTEELARTGQRDAALVGWEQARAAGAPLPGLLGSLLAILPGAENARERLVRLDALAAGGAAADGLLQWHRAHALEHLGRLADAEAALASASGNRTADVERVHARLLRLLGRPIEAAARLLPAAHDGDEQSLQDLITVADSLAQARRWEESLALYDQVAAIEPNDERAAANRVLTLSQSGRGLEGYRELVQRFPARADVLNNAALAELGWGHRDEARALLERAVVLDGAIDARENLAQVLLAGEPPDGARAAALLEQVLAEDPVRDRALYLRLLAARAAPAGAPAPR